MATYYVKNGGNDSADGLTDVTAWAHHPWMSGWTGSVSLLAGDTVYLNRGDEWYDTITISVTGTIGNPITIDAYGTGDKPLLNGFTTITSGWTLYPSDNNISYKNITSSALPGYVLIDDIQYPMGRWPNGTTWYFIDSHDADISITDSELDSTVINWTGADLVQRKNHYVIDRYTITGHSAQTVSYSGSGSIPPSTGWGYYIQNDIKTLDVYSEWYYNTSTSNLYVYFGSELPTDHTVKVSTLNYLVNFTTYKDYIDIKNISFTGTNNFCINLATGCDHINIEDCDFDYCNYGAIGAYSITVTNLTVDGCNINHSNNYGVYTSGSGTNTITVRNCIISNTGLIVGHIGPSSNRQRGTGIGIGQGDNNVIEYNSIYEVGYCGIVFTGTNTTIEHNFIDGYCYTMDDGGGIYYGAQDPDINYEINYNIVLNSYIPSNSMPVGTASMARGIYLDFYSNYCTIDHNIVAHSDQYGIFLHGSQYITITNNTVYDCDQACLGTQYYSTWHTRNVTMNNNKFVTKYSIDYCTWFSSSTTDFDLYGVFDYNYYAKPLAPTYPIMATTGSGPERTLAQWQALSLMDYNSEISPVTLASVDDIHFIYNETESNKLFQLSASMKDVTDTNYNGIIELEPWTSLILLGVGTVTEIGIIMITNPNIHRYSVV